MTTPAPRLSHARGASSPPLQHRTIGQALADTVARHGPREALVVPHQAVRWTWAELAERADAVAAGLLAMGLQPGDRVGIWAPNCAEWVLTQFATARATVTAPPHLSPLQRPDGRVFYARVPRARSRRCGGGGRDAAARAAAAAIVRRRQRLDTVHVVGGRGRRRRRRAAPAPAAASPRRRRAPKRSARARPRRACRCADGQGTRRRAAA